MWFVAFVIVFAFGALREDLEDRGAEKVSKWLSETVQFETATNH